MLHNPSQFSQQGLIPQFPGLQATGQSPFGPSLFGQPGFGQPGSYGANGQTPYPYGAQQSVFAGAANPFTQSPLLQNPSLYGAFQSPFQNPFQNQLGAYSFNPLLASGVPQGGLHPAQQGVQILGQLAQYLLTHGAITQQTGFAIQQLAQQLVQLVQQVTAMQNAAGQPSLGLGPFGQSFGQGVPFGTQAQGWAANRPPTIQ